MKPHITANQHRSQHTAGQSLVEFALVLPVLLLLVLGALDLGRLFSTKITLTNAAREGANYLARHPTDALNGYANTINAATNEASLPSMSISSVNCSPKDTDFSCMRGGTATVETTANVNLIVVSLLNLQSIQLASTVEMLVQ